MNYIKYIGVDDLDIDLFESQYIVPEGMSYNSYLIEDEKIAIMDTADRRKGDEWKANLTAALAGRKPDYLVAHHMEPDHASLIAEVLEAYPELQLVCSAQALKMLPNFWHGFPFDGRVITVKEGDTLICQTGCYDSYLGEVNVTIKNHRVVDKSAKLLGLEEVNRLAPTPDQEVLREIERSTKSAQPMLEKVIGQSSRKFQYNRGQIRTEETELGDYAADAYRGISGADIAIVNAGTFRADIPQGTITRGDTIKVFPFGNVVQKIQVTGAQVKEALSNNGFV